MHLFIYLFIHSYPEFYFCSIQRVFPISQFSSFFSISSSSLFFHSCVCPAGFARDGASKRCLDIDECDSDNLACGLHADCINTQGSFSCKCNIGFSALNQTHCEDINECTQVTISKSTVNRRTTSVLIPKCGEHSTCNNSAGGYSCKCKPGFKQIREGLCQDIDECSLNPCDPDAACTNTVGSFRCECSLGYGGNGFECKKTRCQTGRKLPANVVYQECFFGRCYLTCRDGFTPVDNPLTTAHVTCSTRGKFNEAPIQCSKIDHCSDAQLNYCDTSIGVCQISTKAPYFRCVCPDGFRKITVPNPMNNTLFKEKCVDINECHWPDSPCHKDAECVNEIGGYSALGELKMK